MMMMMTVRDIILVIYNIYIYLNITNSMDEDVKGHYTVIYNIYIYLNITNPIDDDDDGKGHYTSHI